MEMSYFIGKCEHNGEQHHMIKLKRNIATNREMGHVRVYVIFTHHDTFYKLI